MVNCLECGEPATLVGGEAIYPHRPDLFYKSFWLCECGAYCGCHSGTTAALGFPCGAKTRKARMLAHTAFDPIWKNGQMTRKGAYVWLAQITGVPYNECHIGNMNAEQAMAVVNACVELADVWEKDH